MNLMQRYIWNKKQRANCRNSSLTALAKAVDFNWYDHTGKLTVVARRALYRLLNDNKESFLLRKASYQVLIADYMKNTFPHTGIMTDKISHKHKERNDRQGTIIPIKKNTHNRLKISKKPKVIHS